MKLSMGLNIRFGEVDGKIGYRMIRDAEPGGDVKVLTVQAGAESAGALTDPPDQPPERVAG